MATREQVPPITATYKCPAQGCPRIWAGPAEGPDSPKRAVDFCCSQGCRTAYEAERERARQGAGGSGK